MTLRQYVKDMTMHELMFGHAGKGDHVGATREDLEMRLRANYCLSFCSTLCASYKEISEFLEKNLDYPSLKRWFIESKEGQRISFVLDLPSSFKTIRINRAGAEYDCRYVNVVLVRTKSAFRLVTLYPY